MPELTTEAAARAAVQIARPLGKDPNTEPIIDARLADGSRVAICGPPAVPAAAITIRRFGGREFTIGELTATGSLPAVVVEEAGAVLGRERNLLISGGTGSGKTTLLNALVSLLPADGRIISIEDTLELRLRRANCLRFEARGLGGRGVTIRDLVRHALRHRPDHIVVGEVRGAEAADLLQALNTGHGGSLATVHANNAAAALSRLATCAMQASDALPWTVVCRGVVDGIEAVIHQTRTPEGMRRVEQMVRVRDYDAAENRWVVEPVWPPPSRGRERRLVDAEAWDGIPTEAEASEAGAVSRLGDAPRTVAGETPAGGLVLRTLADHRRFELTACCTACERYVVLDHAALAARFGWDAPLDALRRRLACRRCGARTGSVLIGHARGPEVEDAQPGEVEGGEG